MKEDKSILEMFPTPVSDGTFSFADDMLYLFHFSKLSANEFVYWLSQMVRHYVRFLALQESPLICSLISSYNGTYERSLISWIEWSKKTFNC